MSTSTTITVPLKLLQDVRREVDAKKAVGVYELFILENSSASDYISEPFANSANELEELRDLAANWDGEGANPISGGAIARAEDILQLIADSKKIPAQGWIAPAIGPCADGSLDLEWESDERSLLLAIPSGEYPIRCLLTERSITRTAKTDLSGAVESILWFFGKQ